MVKLQALQGANSTTVSVKKGTLVTEALQGTPFEIRTGCNGNGACGICAIRVLAGEVSPPSLPERMHLSSEDLSTGTRLACQTRLLSDVRLELANARMASGWRLMQMEETAAITEVSAGGRHAAMALCIDMGTSRLRMSLIDIASGSRLIAASGPNPLPGNEVIGRLQAAAAGAGEEEAEALRRSLSDGVELLRKGSGLHLGNVKKVIVVGNTAMQAILRNECQEDVLSTASWSARSDRGPISLPALAEAMGVSGAKVQIVPPLGGFIGSDLLAGMLASDLRAAGPALLIDLGMNTEIALWTGESLLATSAAGGSALEGAGITCGTAANPGGAYHVRMLGDGRAELIVIGGGRPTGLTGSGLLDALAMLRARGKVDELGRATPGRVWIDEGNNLYLTKMDVDALQRAKGAVAAALHVLLDKAGLEPRSLQRVFLAGTLGRYLELSNAVYLGLLPPLPLNRFVQMENAALLGAELYAREGAGPERLDRLAEETEFVNLADADEFDDHFLEHLRLRPWPGQQTPSSFAVLGSPQGGLVRAAQYISDMRLDDDNQERLGQMVIRLFEADMVAFVDGKGMRTISHPSAHCPDCPFKEEIMEEAAMVLDSGFMSTMPPTAERQVSIALVPMQVEDKTLAMVIVHDIPEEMPKERLDVYLALARNAGSILTRLEQERELIAHRTTLANLVEERTRALEESNAKLRQEMEMRARDEEAIRLANKKLNLLSSMTRHDIINQVTAVLGYVHLMETKGLPQEKMHRYLGKIEEVTSNIQRLIEFTRDYQDLGVRGPTWEQIDEDFWRAAVAFRDSGLTFTSEVEGLDILSDQMLNKVFHNLIDNTIRHGEHATHCGISYELAGEDLLLHYRDNGVGIQYEEKSLVFERGFGKNTGLGLFLVREIITITGMDITEKGKPGEGVDFVIHVPKGGFHLRPGKPA